MIINYIIESKLSPSKRVHNLNIEVSIIMKIDIEVPRKYVRTIPNNRFRIIQDCEGNLQTIFAISLRDDETKKLLSPNTRHSRINRRYESKITRFGKRCFNETTFSP